MKVLQIALKAIPTLINLLKESFDKLSELEEDINELKSLTEKSEKIKEQQQLELGIEK